MFFSNNLMGLWKAWKAGKVQNNFISESWFVVWSTAVFQWNCSWVPCTTWILGVLPEMICESVVVLPGNRNEWTSAMKIKPLKLSALQDGSRKLKYTDASLYHSRKWDASGKNLSVRLIIKQQSGNRLVQGATDKCNRIIYGTRCGCLRRNPDRWNMTGV